MESGFLFVCMGNICRSPLAQGIAEGLYNGWKDAWLDTDFLVVQKAHEAFFDSAGISGFHRGEAPCKGSQDVAAKHGLDISCQRSRPIRLEDSKKFDYLIAMDDDNIQSLKKMGFAEKQILRIGDFGNGLDIPDPYYYRDMKGFEMIYEMLYPAIKNLLCQYAVLR